MYLFLLALSLSVPTAVQAEQGDMTYGTMEARASINDNLAVIQSNFDEVYTKDAAHDTAIAGKVGTTGNETIAGVKTFSSSPIFPTPTTDMQGSTKKYVDDTVTAAGGYTDEQSQDATGEMVTGNTETGIAITYDDTTGKLNFVVDFSGYEPVKGADDYYVTGAEKTRIGGLEAADSPVFAGMNLGAASTTTGLLNFYGNAKAFPFGLFSQGADNPGIGWRLPSTMPAGTYLVTVDTNGYVDYLNPTTFLTPSGVGGALTVTATGFNGNLETTDNTIQEIAQKFDDFVAGGSIAFNDLSDVDTTGWATGKVVKFDASGNLIVGDDNTGSGTLPDGTAINQLLQWDGDSWEPVATIAGIGNISGAGSYNKVTVTEPATGATLTLADGSTFATSGAYSLTQTLTGNSNVTFPTTGTLATLSDLPTDGTEIGQTVEWDGDSWEPVGTVTITAGANITISAGEISVTANSFQPDDSDLDDLADGSLTGSKVGTGINGDNVTSGTIADARVASTITRTVAYGTVELNTTTVAASGVISAGESQLLATHITATGALAASDGVDWYPVGDWVAKTGFVPSQNGMLSIWGFVDADGYIQLRISNNTASSITLGTAGNGPVVKWAVRR